MTSKRNVIHKAVSHGAEFYLCGQCAEGAGGRWPEGHKATFHGGTCYVCSKKASLCALSDWQWPTGWGSKLDREF